MWRAVERIIPDIRQRCEITMVRSMRPISPIACPSVRYSGSVLSLARTAREAAATPDCVKAWSPMILPNLRGAGGHAPNAQALFAAGIRQLRPWHQGWRGDFPWTQDAHPR